MEALERIWNGDGKGKYGDDPWMQRSDREDMNHANIHQVKDEDESVSVRDADSGEYHTDHQILRLFCRSERRRIRDEMTANDGNGAVKGGGDDG